MVACSGSDTKEDEDAAAAAAAAAARAAQEAAAGSAYGTDAERQRLMDAAAAYGNVFYFAFDSSNLTPEAIAALDAHIAVLKTNNSTFGLKATPTSAAPVSTTWLWASVAPIQCVTTWCLNGIATSRIEAISYGEEHPVAFGSDEANWAQNRRVELVVVN